MERETLENGNLYKDLWTTGLIIKPDWTCIINYLWKTWQYYQIVFDKSITDDYCIENKKKILEEKEEQFFELIHTFNL